MANAQYREREDHTGTVIGIAVLAGIGYAIWWMYQQKKKEEPPPDDRDRVPPEPANILVEVKDGKTGLALDGADVSLNSTLKKSIGGAAGFRDVSPGSYRLQVSKGGYVTVNKTLSITSDKDYTITVRLTPHGHGILRLFTQIRGRKVDEVVNVVVDGATWADPTYRVVWTGTVNASSYYPKEVAVPLGRWYAKFSKSGYRDVNVGPKDINFDGEAEVASANMVP
jgi:hypothetical protein